MEKQQSRKSHPHIWFVGGAPCSGKSTIVDLLAKQYDLSVYHLDQRINMSPETYDPIRQPVMRKWTTLPWEKLWMQSPTVLFNEVVAAYEEQFHLAMAEIAQMPEDQPVIAEGNPFMPYLLQPLLQDSRQAVWVISTDDFLRTTYLNKRKDFIGFILRDCSQPEQAAANWMDRDVAFAGWVRHEAKVRQLNLIEVDGTHTIEENAELVASVLGLKV